MGMDGLNTGLLWDIAQEIQEHPDEYNQMAFCEPGDTFCKTAHCVAGWAVKLVSAEVYDWAVMTEVHCGTIDGFDLEDHTIKVFGEKTGIDVSDWDSEMDEMWSYMGRKTLGLNRRDADYLFNGYGRGRHKLTPGQALEKIATGVPMRQVWNTRYPRS